MTEIRDLITVLEGIETIEGNLPEDGDVIEDVLFSTIRILKQIESMESEYNAYHYPNDYWRGIRYTLDIIERGLY